MYTYKQTNSAKRLTKSIVFAAFLKNFYQTFNDVMQRK
jgi:hypothetical protein